MSEQTSDKEVLQTTTTSDWTETKEFQGIKYTIFREVCSCRTTDVFPVGYQKPEFYTNTKKALQAWIKQQTTGQLYHSIHLFGRHLLTVHTPGIRICRCSVMDCTTYLRKEENEKSI